MGLLGFGFVGFWVCWVFIKTDDTAYPAWLWPSLSWDVAIYRELGIYHAKGEVSSFEGNRNSSFFEGTQNLTEAPSMRFHYSFKSHNGQVLKIIKYRDTLMIIWVAWYSAESRIPGYSYLKGAVQESAFGPL